MLHGRGSTKEQAAKEFGWIELADKQGFLAVFPQALPIIPTLAAGTPAPPSVPSGLGPTNDTLWWSSDFVRNQSSLHHPDDGIFIKLLVLKLVVEKHADSKRIFVAGFSSGGGMVADLAARFQETIHAFAVVAAVGGLRPAKVTSPVSLLLFAGDADSVLLDAKRWAYIPDEAKLSWFGQLTLPTLSSEAKSWAVLDGCKRSIDKRVPWGRRTVWTGCMRGSHLEVYLVQDLGHEWPGDIVSRWNQDHASLPPWTSVRSSGIFLGLLSEEWAGRPIGLSASRKATRNMQPRRTSKPPPRVAEDERSWDHPSIEAACSR
jgi:polyhydroxybutyrate depolymerase